MVTALNRKARLTMTLVGAMLALSVGLIAGPASAQASTSPYCGGWQAAGHGCFGAARWLYQTYGWGNQAGVCVAWGSSEMYCVPRANEGVYSPNAGSNVWAQPYILNPAGVSNYLNGVALTH